MRHFFAYGLFLRGTVGYGQFEQSKNTFLGPAIDDVAEWYEKADWIGVAATPRTSYWIDRFGVWDLSYEGFHVQQFVRYPVPGKGGLTFALQCYNWPSILQASFNQLPMDAKTSEAKAMMEKLFSEQAPFGDSVLRKYENTIRFVEFGVAEFINRNRESLNS
jgi:hypothetical protein